MLYQKITYLSLLITWCQDKIRAGDKKNWLLDPIQNNVSLKIYTYIQYRH
jgi:hypothetical protein